MWKKIALSLFLCLAFATSAFARPELSFDLGGAETAEIATAFNLCAIRMTEAQTFDEQLAAHAQWQEIAGATPQNVRVYVMTMLSSQKSPYSHLNVRFLNWAAKIKLDDDLLLPLRMGGGEPGLGTTNAGLSSKGAGARKDVFRSFFGFTGGGMGKLALFGRDLFAKVEPQISDSHFRTFTTGEKQKTKVRDINGELNEDEAFYTAIAESRLDELERQKAEEEKKQTKTTKKKEPAQTHQGLDAIDFDDILSVSQSLSEEGTLEERLLALESRIAQLENTIKAKYEKAKKEANLIKFGYLTPHEIKLAKARGNDAKKIGKQAQKAYQEALARKDKLLHIISTQKSWQEQQVADQLKLKNREQCNAITREKEEAIFNYRKQLRQHEQAQKDIDEQYISMQKQKQHDEEQERIEAQIALTGPKKTKGTKDVTSYILPKSLSHSQHPDVAQTMFSSDLNQARIYPTQATMSKISNTATSGDGEDGEDEGNSSFTMVTDDLQNLDISDYKEQHGQHGDRHRGYKFDKSQQCLPKGSKK